MTTHTAAAAATQTRHRPPADATAPATTATPRAATRPWPALRTRRGAESPALTQPQAPRLRRRVAVSGIAAPAVFYTVMTLLGQVTPGYNALARYGSELSLGRLGWIMITNFIVLGIVEITVGVAAARALGDRWSGRLAAAAVGVVGAAFLVAGVCVTDSSLVHTHTWHGMVHALMAAVIFFLAVPTAGIATAWRMRARRPFAIASAVTAVASPALLVAMFSSGHLLGLTERVLIAVVLAWLTAFAAQLHHGDPAGR